MRSFRECPGCRALLTDEELAKNGGICPYCDRKITTAKAPREHGDPDFENPYAPPRTDFHGEAGPSVVPRTLWGKITMAGVLLAEQLPLFAALVLTIWLPGNLLLEAALAAGPRPANPTSVILLGSLIGAFFTPIYTAGIITALAARMNGGRIGYADGFRAGLHHWWRLFTARLVASLFIFVGLICFVVPGIILAIKYMLIDEAVVLEGGDAHDSRWRSGVLTHGKGWLLLAASSFAMSLILLLDALLVAVIQTLGLQDVPALALGVNCLVDVFSAYSICLLFLFYWEARLQEPVHDKLASLKEHSEELL